MSEQNDHDAPPLVQAIADVLHSERSEGGHHNIFHSCPCLIDARRIAALFEQVEWAWGDSARGWSGGVLWHDDDDLPNDPTDMLYRLRAHTQHGGASDA